MPRDRVVSAGVLPEGGNVATVAARSCCESSSTVVRVCWVVGEVGEFVRVGVVVVEFAALAALVPLGVAPARRAQAVAEESSLRRLQRRSPVASLAAAARDLRERPATAGRRLDP